MVAMFVLVMEMVIGQRFIKFDEIYFDQQKGEMINEKDKNYKYNSVRFNRG